MSFVNVGKVRHNIKAAENETKRWMHQELYSPKPGVLEPFNGPERDLYHRLKKHGLKATKRGWPDFFVEKPDGSFFVVEVKPSKYAKLEWWQQRCLQALADAGIQTYRWSPDIGWRRIFPRGTTVSGDDVRRSPL